MGTVRGQLASNGWPETRRQVPEEQLQPGNADYVYSEGESLEVNPAVPGGA